MACIGLCNGGGTRLVSGTRQGPVLRLLANRMHQVEASQGPHTHVNIAVAPSVASGRVYDPNEPRNRSAWPLFTGPAAGCSSLVVVVAVVVHR